MKATVERRSGSRALGSLESFLLSSGCCGSAGCLAVHLIQLLSVRKRKLLHAYSSRFRIYWLPVEFFSVLLLFALALCSSDRVLDEKSALVNAMS
jgi:hypothetical protein